MEDSLSPDRLPRPPGVWPQRVANSPDVVAPHTEKKNAWKAGLAAWPVPAANRAPAEADVINQRRALMCISPGCGSAETSGAAGLACSGTPARAEKTLEVP
jgi:hypothetical protein